MKWEAYPETVRELSIGEFQLEVFRPDFWHVVMGASGKAEQEVIKSAMEQHQIALYKRKGGGGTVLLGPNTLVVTLHIGVSHRYQNLAYFKAINQAMIRVFCSWLDLPYEFRGISDIAYKRKKLVGTSIFRRRHYLLFQASILVGLNRELMHLLLKHPPKEPNYRENRSHAEFVTSFRELGVELSYSKMIESLEMLLPGYVLEEVERAEQQFAMA